MNSALSQHAWALACSMALVAVCISDVTTRRVPNALAAIVFLIGAVYWVERRGSQGLVFALGGAGTGFAIMFFIYRMGLLGAGDVKIFAAFGSWLGASATVWAATLGSLAGGFITVIIIFELHTDFATVKSAFAFTDVRQALERARAQGTTVPYATALATGVLAAATTGAPL